MKKAQLVLVPSPGIGHLVSNIEFAKRLLDQDDSFLITVLVIKAPFAFDVDTFNRSLASIDTRIRYVTLPQIAPPDIDPFRSPEAYISTFLEGHKPHAKEAILNHVIMSDDKSSQLPVVGLVVDFFCTSMIDVGNELGIPSYLYFTSTAAFLGLMLYLPTRDDKVIRIEFEETDPDFVVPSYGIPVPARVMPSVLFNKDGGYKCFVNHSRRFKDCKGIIVNSFDELESYALSSFKGSDGIPPVHAVGPLLNVNGQGPIMGSNKERYDMIMKWLDDQPEKSVVFLCFGSAGSFGEVQLKEIALGLERSGQRFLWSIRKAPPKDEFKLIPPSDCVNYQEILPDGFMERTKNIGMVCGWAPQVQVLAHKAIGGFVSHCGWNSILEGLWYGISIVTWPLYAEQQVNAFQMVKELGLAIEMKIDYRLHASEVIMADEIAKAVKYLMKGGSEVRNKVITMSEKSRQAVAEGGSSFAAFGGLIKLMLGNL